MLVLLLNAALAADIQVVQPGQAVTATERSFLLPEPMYDACLEKALALEDVREDLEDASALILSEQKTAREMLLACSAASASADQARVLAEKDVRSLQEQRVVLVGVVSVLTALVAVEAYVILDGPE